ncbi:MAG: hypothetical protein JXJ04_11600 [Spirochaetales bacterium]|nr:hypothetical protein [Spirochaetales bacterium]
MKFRIFCFFYFFCLLSRVFCADYSVGTILSFSGEVMVDHFGNGSFIPAAQGDMLYKNSVIKTGPVSKATLEIMELTKIIPPLSEVSIEKIITLESRKKNTGWLDSLMNVIDRASDAFFEGEESVDLASRGEEDLLGKDDLFAYETEEDMRPDYLEELIRLGKNDVKANEYTHGELELRKGLCYFGLANYQDALVHLSASYSSIPNQGAPYYLDNLILMLGITHYFLTHYDESIRFFSSFLFRNNVPEYKSFAYWLLADSLVASGRENEAGILLKKAKESCTGSILEAGFFVFLRELS